jgi:penicillin amidase
MLQHWDGHLEPDRVGATIFEIFFSHWTKIVVQERFEGDTATLLAGGAVSLAALLLSDDWAGWFAPGRREAAILETMNATLAWLTETLGPDMMQWSWGRLHTIPLRHYLSGRGDLAHLLDHGGLPIKGDSYTVCNTGMGANYEARSGPGYRLIADLNTSPPGLWAIDGQSQSGHPGSPHYANQLSEWINGRYHYLPLDRGEATQLAVHVLELAPGAPGA